MQRAIVTAMVFKSTEPAQSKYTMRVAYTAFLDWTAFYDETTSDVTSLDVASAIQANVAAAVRADALAKFAITLGPGEVLMPAMILV